MIRTIVQLGKALGLQVTADGVETEAQRLELASAGCALIQAYLNSAPASASVIEALVSARDLKRAA